MPNSSDTPESARVRFDRRNAALLAAALGSLAAGYVLLSRGDTTLAPILLVMGYCVLFPLRLAL